jgi:predicted dehydrogenase
MKRRGFLKTAGAGVVAMTARGASRVQGANSRVRVGLVGCGGRGTLVAGEMNKVDGVEVSVVCDVYARNAESARQQLGGTAKIVGDFRKVIDMQEVDAVLVATPDHWHAIPSIKALEAGKHVYCEKPIEHTIQEGLAILETVKRNPTPVFLTGTQHRSAPHIQQAAQMVQGGEIGEVHFVSVWNYSNSLPGIPVVPDQDPPSDMDWDFYLGPAPWVPYNPNRHGAHYRAWMDYSSGRVCDYGVHRFDSVHQIMGTDTPTSCNASAHRYCLGGAGDHPDVLQATYEYPGWIMSYEALELNSFGSMARITGGLPHHGARPGGKNRPNGMMFAGTRATLIVDRRALELIPEPGQEGRIEPIAQGHDDATGLHAQHFIRCIRDGEEPRCHALVGHRSGVVCHLANISHKVGRKLEWDPYKEVIMGDPEATRLMGQKARKPWDMITL